MSLSVRDVIKRAGRMHGCWASGVEPDADEASDALISYNAMKRALFGTVIGPRLSPRSASGSACQAENGGEYQIPPVAYTVTAPLDPRPGARFGVVDAALNFGPTPCTVVGNGRLLNGAAGPLVLSASGQNARLWFRGDTGNWVLEEDAQGLDTPIEFPDGLIAYMPNMLALVIAAEFGADLRQDVIAGAQEGRAAFARAYARPGRGPLDAPLGVAAVAQGVA
jgi:hypothetical protein